MRVVLDTSVWISALLWEGLPHRLLELAETGSITLCATTETLAELGEVLRRPKFAAKLAERQTTVGETMAGVIRLVELYPAVPAQGTVPADSDDEIFIACALSAGAAHIVSGDEHLLGLEQHGTTKVVTPREFLHQEFPEQLKEQ
jgi:putative PIN family toxin of toxin-antitoxin system